MSESNEIAETGGTVERLKMELLGELGLMRPDDLAAYWKQANWAKPNLVNLAESEYVDTSGTNIFSPLRYGVMRLAPEIIIAASEQLDPYGWLLDATDLSAWSQFCRDKKVPWLIRLWLATASQLRAELRLVFKAHGWSDTMQTLRRNPKSQQAALDFYSAQLNHANMQSRAELLKIQIKGLSEASKRRLRRAAKGQGNRAGVGLAEKFMVQHWLELPHGLPGLCFFSDVGIHSLLETFGLTTTEGEATRQSRVRLGLLQAGAKAHLIEDVLGVGDKLTFTGTHCKQPIVMRGKILWGKRQLWSSIR